MKAAQQVFSRPLSWALAAWAVSVLYYASLFHRRWIPLDEGTLGQSAWRILSGEIPHRDFDAMYTGLQEYMHAAAMTLLGVNLLTPRVVMLAAVMLWVPALWALARRLTDSPAAAAFVTVLAVLLGPPNYPAAMPSWYNLFLATWGLWALVRWSERPRPGWLLLAGACGGLSILFKISGLFFVAGALFFLLHLEAGAPGEASSGNGRGAARSSRRLFAGAATAAVILLVALETLLIRSQMGAATWVNYVLATVFLGGALVCQAWTVEDAPRAMRRTLGSWTLLLVGVLAPILPFVAWYAAAGALQDLYRGVFLLPLTRPIVAAGPVAPLRASMLILIPTALVLAGAYSRPATRIVLCVAVGAAAATLLVAMDPVTFGTLFTSLLLVVPLLAGAGAALLLLPPAKRQLDAALVATLWTLALVNLIRYPYAVLIYFTYVAPLAVLAASGVLKVINARSSPAVESTRLPGGAVPAALGAFYALFFLIGPNRGGMFGPLTAEPERRLALERGRIAVPAQQAIVYEQLVETIKRLSRGPYIYATPDAPEVYFLSGLENPTRTLFEIFDYPYADASRILQTLQAHGVNVVVVNTRPFFSSSVPQELVEELERAYPQAAQIGHFLVRWRGEREIASEAGR